MIVQTTAAILTRDIRSHGNQHTETPAPGTNNHGVATPVPLTTPRNFICPVLPCRVIFSSDSPRRGTEGPMLHDCLVRHGTLLRCDAPCPGRPPTARNGDSFGRLCSEKRSLPWIRSALGRPVPHDTTRSLLCRRLSDEYRAWLGIHRPSLAYENTPTQRGNRRLSGDCQSAGAQRLHHLP